MMVFGEKPDIFLAISLVGSQLSEVGTGQRVSLPFPLQKC